MRLGNSLVNPCLIRVIKEMNKTGFFETRKKQRVTHFDFEPSIALRDEIVGDGRFLTFLGYADR